MFKKFLLLCLALIIISCASPLSLPNIQILKPTSQEMAQKGRDATVAFVTQTMDNKTTYPYCTGIFIDQQTILTALHCARAAAMREEIKKLPPELRNMAPLLLKPVKDPTGYDMTYIVEMEVTGLFMPPKDTHHSMVVAIDIPHDLALLKTSSSIPPHTWLRVADYMPEVGDTVYVMGHPAGLYYTFLDGTVSAIRGTFPMGEEPDDEEALKGPFVQVFSGIFNGNSGGAVYNSKGEIVGIVSFGLRAPNQTFCIAQVSIRSFIFKAHRDHKI